MAGTRINLVDLDPIAFLESEDGVVERAGDKFVLNGGFRLVVRQIRSDVLSFSRNAVVAKSGAGWVLSSLAQVNFFYSTPIRFQDHPLDPFIEAQNISLFQRRTTGSPTLLAFTDIKVSLVGHVTPSESGKLLYPSADGAQEVTLIAKPHPQDPSRRNFFLVAAGEHFQIQLGAVSDRVNINHARQTQIVIHSDCSLSFLLSTGDTALIVDSSTAALGAHVVAAPNSGMLMAINPGQANWSTVRLPSHRIEAREGWIRVLKFAPGTAWLGRVMDLTASVHDATGIFTTTERLTYELSTPWPGEPATQMPKARLHYRDPSSVGTAMGAPANRHFGVRVRGLGSRSGIAAVLDASVAVFNLSGPAASPQLHLKAGGSVPSGNGTESSILVPKVNPKAAARQLNVPVGELSLDIDSPAGMVLDTEAETGGFAVIAPDLSSRPAGISAHSASPVGTEDMFSRWSLGLADGSTTQSFDVGDVALRPSDGPNWLGKFATKDPTQRYELIEHPGAAITMDPPIPSPLFAKEAAEAAAERTGFTTKEANGKEIIAYSTFIAAVSFAGFRCIKEGFQKCADPSRFTVKLKNLNEDTARAYVKRNAPSDLCVVYRVPTTGDDHAVRGIRSFVDANMKETGKPDPGLFVWPFAAGLSIVLYGPTSSKDSTPAYCDEIARIRRPKQAQPTIAFDMSGEAALQPDWLGWKPAEWARLADDSPGLWPRAKNRKSARADPSDPKWRGIFFRDLPLTFPVPRVVGDELPFLKVLLDTINDNLMLDYGWHDESGATWSGSLFSADPGLEFTPDGWKSTLQMFLTRVGVKGAASKIVSADAKCRVQFNRITRVDRIAKKDTHEPLGIVGAFVLNLDGGNPAPHIELSSDGAPFETDSVPGFKTVILKRVVITNLQTAQFDLELVATPELSKAIPAFSETTPQKATLTFNLKGTPSATLSLTLPSEIDSNLFGRWPITLEGVSIKFAANADDLAELRIRGRLHLGLPAFSAVGAWISVTAGKDGLKFNIEIDDVSGQLSLGSSKVSIELKWADKDHVDGPVPLDQVSTAGAHRDFYGMLTMEDPGVLGKNALAVRVGNRGEMSFWIAAIESTEEIPLGVGKLQNPALLFAHHAELGQTGNMAKAITDPTGSVLNLLRPPDESGDRRAWLAGWEPSKGIGTLIAGSGYLHLHDEIAAAPGNPKKPNPKLLSSLIFTDTGLVRIDGVAMLLGVTTIRFGIAVDFKARRLTAGLQAPTISVPDPKNPEYQIQSGYIVLGVGFAGEREPYLSLRVGWPERVGGTEFDRDWSKSVKVYVQKMYPINTFWGGMRSELDPGKGRVVMGWAIRAGWTWTADKGFSGVAKARANLGITLGGVFQFAFAWKENPKNTPLLLARAPALPAFGMARSELQSLMLAHLDRAAADERQLILTALDLMERTLSSASVDVIMDGELFGDIWGDASVEFMSVTLAALHLKAFARLIVCGSFNRGIMQAKGTIGFEVSVTILCVTYSTHASLDIVLIDGTCPLMLDDQTVISQGDLALLLPAA